MRKKANFALLIFFALLPLFLNASEGSIYTRSADFSPKILSYDELISILLKVQSFLKSANKDLQSSIESEVTIGKGKLLRVTYKGELSKDTFKNAPKSATSADYLYRKGDGVISRLKINLNDYNRSVEIEGKSREQVDALLAMICNEFDSLNWTIGGGGARYVLFLIFLILGSLGMGLAYSPIALNLYLKISCAIIGIVSISLSFLLLLGDYPSGVKIQTGDVSFINQYGAIIGLIASLITIFIFLISIFKPFFINKNK